jgi:hypothetical protein
MILSNNEMYQMNNFLKIPNLKIITKIELNNIKYNNKDNFIVNFDDYNNGTHWVSIYQNIYFDSYGIIAPDNIENYMKKGYIYNDIQLQPLNLTSLYCGWFCLYFLDYMNNHNEDNIIKFHNFIKLFNNNNIQNNKKIIYDYFIKKIKNV